MHDTVAFVGEAMIEIAPDAGNGAVLHPAGDVLNSAHYLRQCANGTQVRFVTALGDDPFSDRIADFLRDTGLDTGGVRRVAGVQCGLYSVITDAAGERSFHYWRSVSAARGLFGHDADFDALSGAGIVYLSGITLAIISDAARARLLEWAAGARGRGVRIAFDSNYRPALWPDRVTAQDWTERMWRLTDIGFPSADDEAALFGDADLAAMRARFAGYGIAAGALKNGSDGAYLLGGSTHVPALADVHVVDTTAAGDSFNAGYLAAVMRGAGPTDAARAGHRVAAQVVGQRGAIVTIETDIFEDQEN